MVKTILIEDEASARMLLKDLLEEFIPSVEIIGEAASVKEGIQLIRRQKPDLVFLDLELKGNEGWEVLEYFRTFDFQVIVTTAYDQHALRSYDYQVVDYLMKPLTPGKLKKAYERIEKRFTLKIPSDSTPAERPELKIPVANGYRYVPIDRIIRLEGSRNYSWIYLKGENPVLLTKNLSIFGEQLAPHDFLRVHHSHLVNPIFIESFDRQTDLLHLTGHDPIPVSRERRKSVMDHMARR